MPRLSKKAAAEYDAMMADIQQRMKDSNYVLLEVYIHRLSGGWYGEALGIHISRPAQPGQDDNWYSAMPCHYLLRWITNGGEWISQIGGIALPKVTLDKINELVSS